MARFFIPIILFIIYLTIGIATITHYGINWDEPAHFMRGQAFLRFFLTGEKDYRVLPPIDGKSYVKDYGYEFVNEKSGKVIRRSIYQQDYRHFLFYTEDIEKRGSHPAFSDVMAALSNQIFFIGLGIAPDVFSYNYYVVFLTAILVAGIYYWVRKYFGTFAALISSLSLATFPVFWAESHNNVKDIPQAVFFSFAIFVFYEAVTTKKIKYVLLFALVGALAFATKFNFIFIVPIIAFWLILRWLLIYRTKLQNILLFIKKNKLFLSSFLIVPITAAVVWIGTFPAMWFEPRLIPAAFSYYKTVGTTAMGGFNLYILYYLIFATPPVILVYSFIGMIGYFFYSKKREKELILLVVIWFLVTVGRVMVPGTVIYGGVRQVMEYIPAMAILSGIGGSVLIEFLNKFVSKTFLALNQKYNSKLKNIFRPSKFNSEILIRSVLKLFIIFSFLPLLFTLVKLHPNEGVYFNSFIGGLKGAKESDIPDWGQTLGNAHRQGIRWINQNVEKGARLSLNFELWSNLPHIWVRNDIYYDVMFKSGPARQGEYIMSITNKSDFMDWYTARYYDTFIEPVHKLEVDEVPLLKVWKNDNAYLKDEFKNIEEEKITNVPIAKDGQTLTLKLQEAKRLLRIEFHNEDLKFCNGVNKYIGRVQLYRSDKFAEPTILRASAYDFNDKLKIENPYILFAAEKAKVIVLNIFIDDPCFATIKSADVVLIKE